MSALRDSEEPLLSLGRRLGGKTYWDYVLPALARHRCMAPLFHEYGIFMNTANPLYKDPAELQSYTGHSTGTDRKRGYGTGRAGNEEGNTGELESGQSF